MTDIPVDNRNLMTLMRGASARWKFENETFNTLKNQGYHCKHNFGHGNQYLSTVLMQLMMLAFLIVLIDQSNSAATGYSRPPGRQPRARPGCGASCAIASICA